MGGWVLHRYPLILSAWLAIDESRFFRPDQTIRRDTIPANEGPSLSPARNPIQTVYSMDSSSEWVGRDGKWLFPFLIKLCSSLCVTKLRHFPTRFPALWPPHRRCWLAASYHHTILCHSGWLEIILLDELWRQMSFKIPHKAEELNIRHCCVKCHSESITSQGILS